MITFSCPSCSTSYTVADDKAGKRTTCARCHHPLTVPVLPDLEQEWELVKENAADEPRPATGSSQVPRTSRPNATLAAVAFLLALFCFAVAYARSQEADKEDRQAAREADALNKLSINMAHAFGASGETRMAEPKKADRSLVWVGLVGATIMFGVSLICAALARTTGRPT